MKTSLFFAALLCAASLVVAQTKKGDQFLSGSVEINLLAGVASEPNQSTNTIFSPNVYLAQTKFFKDNWAFRWGLGYGGLFNNFQYTNSNGTVFKNSTNNHNLSLSGSWLYFYGQSRWRVFAGLGLGLSQTWERSEATSNANYRLSNSFSLNPQFTVGGLYFLSPKWALSASTNLSSFPINNSGLYAGLIYAPKGKLAENESTQLTTFQKGGSIWGLGFGIRKSTETANPSSSGPGRITNQQTLSVSYGKLIRDRLVLGGSFDFLTASSKFDQPNYASSSDEIYSLGLFLKKYYTTNRLTPFSAVSLNYSWMGGSKTKTTSLGAEAGLAYLISNRFFVEASLANVNLTRTTTNNYVTYGLNARGVLSPSLRIQYVFR